VPLPITTSAFDDLAKRILKDKKRDTDDATWLDVVDAYQDLCDGVVVQLAALGYPGAIPRVKSTPTLFDKMRARPGLAVSKINDFGGVRLIVGSLVYRKGQKFNDGRSLSQDVLFAPGRRAQLAMMNRIVTAFSDGVRSTKAPHVDNRCEDGFDSSGYRAVHIVVYPDGVPIEIQLRTPLQHGWAELSERLGDKWGRAFRYGGQPERPDEIVSPGKTRSMIIEDLRRIANIVSQVETLALEADNRALNAWLSGNKHATAVAEGKRLELDQLYDELQSMLVTFGDALGVGGGKPK
jgi:ppGpp synthetase/RelA/SpoT-type nucleotidyltranferase